MIDSPYGGCGLDLGGDKDSGSGGVKSKGGKSGPLGGMDSNEDGKEKKRKPVPKLDEARLLGLNGFPQLVKDTKNFKPKGGGS
jgi:replication fork protection complex subunit Csm3/Swi3